MAAQCPNCAGRLIFDPASQRLLCESCGSRFAPEEVEDENAERHTKYYDANIYVCSHCGAEVIITGSEASTFCAYCGNPAIVFSRVSKEVRPDGIVPFQITKARAMELIRDRMKASHFIPNEIKTLGEDHLRGIYIPYWIVTADFTDVLAITGKVKDKQSAGYDPGPFDKLGQMRRYGSFASKGYHYEFFARAGSVRFNAVPIDGSRMLNDEFSMKLEPFDFRDARVFDEDYLNGFYSNVSDLSYNELKKSAGDRCHKLFADEVLKTVKAKEPTVTDHISWIDIEDGSPYMLMPVWFFTFTYKGNPHTILVNGQTGKVVGTFPWMKARFGWTLFGIGLPVFVLSCLLFTAMIKTGAYGVSRLFTIVSSLLMTTGPVLLAIGLNGIKRISNNLKLTQSEKMFSYVNRRKG